MKQSFLFVISLVLVVFLTQNLLAGQNDIRRVVNGSEVTNGEWGGVVALSMSMNGGNAMCTATLIDPEVLLTAGHCVYDGREYFNIEVYSNSNVTYGGTSISGVDEIKKHPTWTGEIEYNSIDLALIHLSRPITNLPVYGLRTTYESVGESGMIVGYGLTGSYNNDAGIKRKGSSSIRQLVDSYGAAMIEIGNPSGLCQGDSGGPFFTYQNGQPVVSGVASHITNYECQAGSGSWEMHVYSYREWIDSTVRDWTGHGLLDADNNTQPEDPLVDDNNNNNNNTQPEDPPYNNSNNSNEDPAEPEPDCYSNNDCSIGYECRNGYCIYVQQSEPDNNNGDKECDEIYNCASDCYQTYTGCMSNVSQQGTTLFNSYADCFIENCSNASDYSECVQNNCYSEYSACNQNNNCVQILNCQGNYSICYQDCEDQGSNSGREDFDGMMSCFSSRCSQYGNNESAYSSCIESQCGSQINECFGSNPPGDLSCKEISDCISSCTGEDQECFGSCYNRGTNEARTQMNSLNSCGNQNCSNVQNDGEYQDCLILNCSNELRTCFNLSTENENGNGNSNGTGNNGYEEPDNSPYNGNESGSNNNTNPGNNDENANNNGVHDNYNYQGNGSGNGMGNDSGNKHGNSNDSSDKENPYFANPDENSGNIDGETSSGMNDVLMPSKHGGCSCSVLDD